MNINELDLITITVDLYMVLLHIPPSGKFGSGLGAGKFSCPFNSFDPNADDLKTFPSELLHNHLCLCN